MVGGGRVWDDTRVHAHRWLLTRETTGCMPSPSNFGTSSRTLGTTLFSLEHSAPSSCSFFLFSFFSLLFVFPFSHFKHSAPSSFPPSCARLQLLYNIIEYYRILNYKKRLQRALLCTIPWCIVWQDWMHHATWAEAHGATEFALIPAEVRQMGLVAPTR